MAKYLAVKMGRRGLTGKPLGQFTTINDAFRFREEFYKSRKGMRIAIIGKKGFVGTDKTSFVPANK